MSLQYLIYVAVLLVALAGFEFVIRKLKVKAKTKTAHISEYFDTRLEVIEAMSHVLSSRSGSLMDNLNEVAASFFRQKTYHKFSLIFTDDVFKQHARIIRFVADKDPEVKKDFEGLEKIIYNKVKQGKSTESIEIVELDIHDDERMQNVVIVPLNYHKEKLGFGVFFIDSDLRKDLSENDKHFFISCANLITYILKKMKVDVVIPMSEQLNATNITW